MTPARHRPAPSARAESEALSCLRCGSELEVHQPDLADPHRLLAACESCGGWHLVEGRPAPADALLVLLPEADALAARSGCRSALVAVR